jgi:hypothetical protein
VLINHKVLGFSEAIIKSSYKYYSIRKKYVKINRKMKILMQVSYIYIHIHTHTRTYTYSRSHWLCVLRCWSAAARLVGLRVRIPPGAWMSVSCECRMLSGRGLCVYLITRPEESYWMWCVWVRSWSLDNEEPLAHWIGGGAVAPWEWGGIP